MKFSFDSPPPSAKEIAREHERISGLIRRIKRLDMMISMLVILITTIVACMAVYFTTGNVRMAAITASIFPVVGILLSVTGIISAAGFRSAARQLIELNHQMIELTPVSENAEEDVKKLAAKYLVVDDYWTKTTEMGRSLVNGELALFFGFDASTLGKMDKGKDYLSQAKRSMNASS